MKSEPQWLFAHNIAPEMITGRNVIVKHMDVEINGDLEVESTNSDGRVAVVVRYDRSPFPDSAELAKGFLTQEEFDDFINKGPKCVVLPSKKSDSN